MENQLFSNLKLDKLVHANGFVFLVFAFCTHQVYESDPCQDKENQGFLLWVLYGNSIIYSIWGIVLVLNLFDFLEPCLNNCGAVFVTILVFILYYGLYIFNFCTMLYGIKQHFLKEKSPCKELELFNMVLSYIFVVWLVFLVYTGLIWYCKRNSSDTRYSDVVLDIKKYRNSTMQNQDGGYQQQLIEIKK